MVVLFVEGETEKEFFDALFAYYKANSKTDISPCKIINIKGIGRFESKVSPKLKHEILPKYGHLQLKVGCSYDTDVFELAQKPPTNWGIVRAQVNSIGINQFFEIKAVRMIEDWLLKDLNGLCNFLKIKAVKSVEGKNGYEKMKKLFRKGNKVYQKGSNAHKFIPHLEIKLIREKVKDELKGFEDALGFSTK